MARAMPKQQAACVTEVAIVMLGMFAVAMAVRTADMAAISVSPSCGVSEGNDRRDSLRSVRRPDEIERTIAPITAIAGGPGEALFGPSSAHAFRGADGHQSETEKQNGRGLPPAETDMITLDATSVVSPAHLPFRSRRE
jgi:hypothetical protein